MKLFVPKWICERDSQIETRNYPRFLCASICRQKRIRFCFRVDQTGRERERSIDGEKCGWRWKIRTKFFHFMELQLKLPTPNGQYWWRSPTDKKQKRRNTKFQTQIWRENVWHLASNENRKTNTIRCFALLRTHFAMPHTGLQQQLLSTKKKKKRQQRRRRRRTADDSERWKSETDWFKYGIEKERKKKMNR